MVLLAVGEQVRRKVSSVTEEGEKKKGSNSLNSRISRKSIDRYYYTDVYETIVYEMI